jgi:acyl dehydratase
MHETYESVTLGETIDLGSYDVTEAEIISFARSYDPQAFHLDPAADSPFDGLVASGWHTAAMTMRILVDNYLAEANAHGALGLEGLRWPNPVAPGDTISATIGFTDKEPRSEEYGVVTQEIETVNQDDDTVLWMAALVLYPRA